MWIYFFALTLFVRGSLQFCDSGDESTELFCSAESQIAKNRKLKNFQDMKAKGVKIGRTLTIATTKITIEEVPDGAIDNVLQIDFEDKEVIMDFPPNSYLKTALSELSSIELKQARWFYVQKNQKKFFGVPILEPILQALITGINKGNGRIVNIVIDYEIGTESDVWIPTLLQLLRKKNSTVTSDFGTNLIFSKNLQNGFSLLTRPHIFPPHSMSYWINLNDKVPLQKTQLDEFKNLTLKTNASTENFDQRYMKALTALLFKKVTVVNMATGLKTYRFFVGKQPPVEEEELKEESMILEDENKFCYPKRQLRIQVGYSPLTAYALRVMQVAFLTCFLYI